MQLERGSASMLVDLTDGMITVTHGTDKVVLLRRKARAGTWDNIWKDLRGEN